MRHPDFLKIGLKVRYHMPNGAVQDGRVDGNDRRSNGTWTAVNIAPKGMNRILKHFRPSQLRAV